MGRAKSPLSPEFLEAHGFTLREYPDGMFWVRVYNVGYTLQANEAITDFTEDDGGWIEELTAEEFYMTIIRHDQAIKFLR